MRGESTPSRLYRRWWLGGSWTIRQARVQVGKLANTSGDGMEATAPVLRALWPGRPDACPTGEWQAACRSTRHRGQEVPAPACACGIYGCESPDEALNHANFSVDKWQALGEVAVSGRVLSCRRNGVWRAERVKLTALFDISDVLVDIGKHVSARPLPVGLERLPAGMSDALAKHLVSAGDRGAVAARDYKRVLGDVADQYGVPVIPLEVGYDGRRFTVRQ